MAATENKSAAVGKVAEITGGAVVVPAGMEAKSKTIPLAVGSELNKGDLVVTGAGSAVTVEFLDKSTMKIGEKTKIQIKIKGTKATSKSKLHLFNGKVRLRVKGGVARGLFEVTTPAAVAGVRGTDFLVVYSAGVSKVVVFEGVVAVKSLMEDVGRAVNVPAAHSTQVRMGREPAAPARVEVAEIQQLDRSMEMKEEKGGEAGAEEGAPAEGGEAAEEEPAEEEPVEEGEAGEGEAAAEEGTGEGEAEPAAEEATVVVEEPVAAEAAPVETETVTPTATVVEVEQPVVVPDETINDALLDITRETAQEVLTEEAMETVSEEIQEVSAGLLPEPRAPPVP